MISNPRGVSSYTWSAHMPLFKDGYSAITENGSYLAYSHVFYDAHYNKLQINHYYTKYEKEFREKQGVVGLISRM